MKKKELNLLQIKAIGLLCTVLLNLAWSGILKNTAVCFVCGLIGSAGITLFLFAMNEALQKTSNLTRYMLRVLILSVLSAVPYHLVYYDYSDSLLRFRSYFSSPFTLFFCIGALVLYDRIAQKRLRTASVLFFCIVSFFLGLEWAPYAVILAYFLHLYGDKPRYRDYNIILFFTVIAAVCGVFLLSGSDLFNRGELLKNISLIGCLLGIPVIRRYNGLHGSENMGKRAAGCVKWAFYLFYPLLLALLLAVKFCLAGA